MGKVGCDIWEKWVAVGGNKPELTREEREAVRTCMGGGMGGGIGG